MDNIFKITIPAIIQKSENKKDWRVWGLASTDSKDLQGETIDLSGLDLTPIKNRKGIINWDHSKTPEDQLGIIDSYKMDGKGLYLGGYLFPNHSKAKAVYEIMSSLKDEDKGRMGMSVEGVIKERAGDDGKVIKNAIITGVALTMAPVNTETYVDLVKSFNAIQITGDSISDHLKGPEIDSQLSFTPTQVFALLEKALGIGSGYATTVPGDMSGGTALAAEDLDKDKESVVTFKAFDLDIKKGNYELFKSNLNFILMKLQMLYPGVPKEQLWDTVKERLNTRFPSIKSTSGIHKV